MRKLAIFALIFGFATSIFAANDKKIFTERYKGKYLLVLKEGLAFGVCEDHEATRGLFNTDLPMLSVLIRGESVEYKRQTSFLNCGAINPEPLHKGDVLRVTWTGARNGYYSIATETSVPHQLERGVGAFAHQSAEIGGAYLNFEASSPEQANAIVALWVREFNSLQEASEQISNTTSGVYVKQVKLGMTFAEVEQVLGPPVTLIDLESKKLYKYKDMTVEFKDGKVVDVR